MALETGALSIVKNDSGEFKLSLKVFSGTEDIAGNLSDFLSFDFAQEGVNVNVPEIEQKITIETPYVEQKQEVSVAAVSDEAVKPTAQEPVAPVAKEEVIRPQIIAEAPVTERQEVAEAAAATAPVVNESVKQEAKAIVSKGEEAGSISVAEIDRNNPISRKITATGFNFEDNKAQNSVA